VPGVALHPRRIQPEITSSAPAFPFCYANLIAAAVDRLRFLSEIQKNNERLEHRSLNGRTI
jgi:hypothetical protein